jgi:hypothetical protein
VEAIAQVELFISLTLSTMYVLVKLIKYLDDILVCIVIIDD